MNAVEHTFPLPEVETHKLDEVKEGLRHRPVEHLMDFFNSNAGKWTLVCATGFLAGLWLRRHLRG